MTDPLRQRIADERGQIVLKEAHEVQYWTQHLGVSEPALRAAVEAVGHSAPKVREYLTVNRPQ